ncbi:MAG: 50S ribosomal protein L20 [Candidatus Paceibacterota bacterium]|jgi:large subunit ribosomal protein L20
MTRVKRGTLAHKKREKLLKLTKGFKWGRKSKERAAKEALLHSMSRMFKGRKEKKREFRALWQTRVSAGARTEGMSYSVLMGSLKKKKVEIDRKILADLAANEPKVFAKIVAYAKQ